MSGRIVAATAVMAGCTFVAAARYEPPKGDTGESSVLAGPRVAEDDRVTLVERDVNGAIKRTETAPELAAVQRMELSDEVMTKIDAIALRRSRFFDSFIENNLDLLSKLDTAGNTNDRVDQTILSVQALGKLSPLLRDGSLRKQIKGVLTSGEAERFDTLLNEYWDAIAVQERELNPEKSRFEIVSGERMAAVFREVEAAFARLEKSGVLVFKYFFSEMKLSKEQEGEIRAILDDFVEETGGAPTKQQEQAVFLAVMSKLDTKQQTELVKSYQSREKGAKPTKK